MKTNNNLDEIIENVWTYGVGTNASDIAGNEKAYLNLKIHAHQEAKQDLRAIMEEVVERVIGKNEKLKDVSNRSILDAPKVKIQNLYRADRNNLRQSQRTKATKELDKLFGVKDL